MQGTIRLFMQKTVSLIILLESLAVSKYVYVVSSAYIVDMHSAMHIFLYTVLCLLAVPSKRRNNNHQTFFRAFISFGE